MVSPVRLQGGRLSAAFLKALNAYYAEIEGGEAFVAGRWAEWRSDRALTRYVATRDGRTIGWMVYDRRRSAILEVMGTDAGPGKERVSAIIDTLIAKESLVSAEILKGDKKRYDLLVRYGFRPASSIYRYGLLMQKMDLSTSVLLERTRSARPARPYRRKEHVVIEKVPETLRYEEIRDGIRRLVQGLGGIRRFVKAGQTVAIKPNIVSDHGLKDGVAVGGIVTDVRVIKALVELLLPLAGKILITEGSSINRSETVKMFAHYGYDGIVALDPSKVSLVDLNTDELVEKAVPRGKRMASRRIPATLDRADVIINVPVLKIHFAAVASLSIKNLQGAMPPLEKYMTHFFGLWQNLVNIHHIIQPRLIIVDGLTGLEDFGPISGTPKPMHLLIGGTNPVAVDATAMRIMGIDPLSSPPVRLAYLQGFGPVEAGKIDVRGARVADVAKPFKQPVIDIRGGRNLFVHAGDACQGCTGYLHFALSKLRKPDPADENRLLVDRPLTPAAHIYLGPVTSVEIEPGAQNIFMGLCQQHHAALGTHLPGCPPHAEVIMDGVFSLYPDVERPKYANKSEEAKLGEMLHQVLEALEPRP